MGLFESFSHMVSDHRQSMGPNAAPLDIIDASKSKGDAAAASDSITDFSVRRIPSKSGLGDSISDNMIVSTMPKSNTTIRVALTSQACGTFRLGMTYPGGAVDLIPILIPMCAQVGDVLEISIADVIADVIMPNQPIAVNDLHSKEATSEPLVLGAAARQVFRVLSVPVPECVAGSKSSQPLSVYFQTAPSTPRQDYVLVPHDVKSSLVAIAVPHNQQYHDLWREHSIEINDTDLADRCVSFNAPDPQQIITRDSIQVSVRVTIPKHACRGDKVFYRAIDFCDPALSQCILPQLKLHNHVQLYLRRVFLPSSAGSEIPASSICASGNLFCVASPVINLRQITITLLSDGGGGILPLSLPDNTGSNFHYLSVQIPLSARPGDTLKVQLADVCSQKTPIVVNELRSKEIQGRYPDFGANITGQVFRVLCARVPECATGDSTQPVNVYFKFKNSDLQEYCLIPLTYSRQHH